MENFRFYLPRFKMKRLWLTVFLLVSAASALLNAQEMEISTEKQKNLGYVSTAVLKFSPEYMDTVRRILCDLDNYNDWALTGLNGKDEVSKDFIGILDALNYNSLVSVMDMKYSVNLPWPFRSTGKSLFMKPAVSGNEYITSVEFVFEENSGAIKSGTVIFSVRKSDEDTALLEVWGAIKLAWYFDIFVTEKTYKKSVEVKVLQIAKNLINYGQDQYAEALLQVDKS